MKMTYIFGISPRQIFLNDIMDRVIKLCYIPAGHLNHLRILIKKIMVTREDLGMYFHTITDISYIF